MNESTPTPLERVEATGNLQALQRDPDKVIRSERFDALHQNYGTQFEAHELASRIKGLYEELETTYNISVPADFVVDTDVEGNTVLATAVDRIDGVNLNEAEYSQQLAEKVERLYTSVAQYLFDKNQKGGYFLCDINSMSQYMYGTRKGDVEPNIYLVDTDAYFNSNRKGLYLVIEWLCRHMSGAERLCHTKFSDARNYIQQFLNEPLPVDVSDDEKDDIRYSMLNITAFLHGEKFGPAPEIAIPVFNK